jgi:hypothetical protein
MGSSGRKGGYGTGHEKLADWILERDYVPAHIFCAILLDVLDVENWAVGTISGLPCMADSRCEFRCELRASTRTSSL